MSQDQVSIAEARSDLVVEVVSLLNVFQIVYRQREIIINILSVTGSDGIYSSMTARPDKTSAQPHPNVVARRYRATYAYATSSKECGTVRSR